jgi:hypothetical protein
MISKNKDTRCSGRTKKGKSCRAAATLGGLCYFHANPNKASELGRIGGRSKRHDAGEMADPLPVLNNAIAVRDTLARLIVDIHTGKLQPKIAASLASLLNLQLRTIETVTKLEAEAQAKRDVDDGRPVADLTDAELEQRIRSVDDPLAQEQEQAPKAFRYQDALKLSESLLNVA